MKIYGCQIDIAWEDKLTNHRKVLCLLAAVKPDPGSLVFLPEMFATGFSMNVKSMTEDPMSGPTSKFLADCAREFGIYLAGGIATMRTDGKARNEMIVLAPDGTPAAQYAKINPFTFGEESRHYSAGDRICTFPWGGTTVSPFICYDLRFPEIFRRATRGGAEVLAVIASWPFPRDEHWITLLRARAIENQCYVIGVNRCGRDPKFSYPGRSMVVDPHGTMIADAGNAEGVVSSEIDVSSLRAYRKQFPILGDVRPEFLGL